MELPGFAKDGVDISFDDGILTISGERKFDRKEDSRYHRLERRYGQFQRSFRLPNSVDIENAAATLNEGVLQLVVPKREEAKPRQIPVRVQLRPLRSRPQDQRPLSLNLRSRRSRTEAPASALFVLSADLIQLPRGVAQTLPLLSPAVPGKLAFWSGSRQLLSVPFFGRILTLQWPG